MEVSIPSEVRVALHNSKVMAKHAVKSAYIQLVNVV